MHEKLTEIMAEAKGWLTAAEMAEKGGWRSPAHVGLALKQMSDVEHRSSPTKKMGNGMPAKEYKLTWKEFSSGNDDAKPTGRKSKSAEPAPAFSQPADDSQIETLRAQLRNAEQMRDEHFASLEGLQDDMRRQVQRAVAAEASRDDLKKQVDDLFVQLNDAQVAYQSVTKTLALIALNLEFVEGDDLVSKVCTVMHERIHAKDAVDVKDAAIGYIVRVAGKKPRICMKPESARNAALASAKAHGRADVLAMVPVGSAKRDAVFKDAA